MLRNLVSFCIFALVAALPVLAQVKPETTLTFEQQEAPTFNCTTLDGKEVSLKSLRGKVVLLCFFTTSCEPCLEEIPLLEKNIWQRFKDKKFAMLAIGRGHENNDLKDFATNQKVTFPFAGDATQKIFSQYATLHVPRNYVIDPAGKIVIQSVGYNGVEFAEMVATIEDEIGKIK